MDPATLGLDPAADAFASAAVGGQLAPAVADLIDRAGRLRLQPEQALDLLLQAQAAAPDHPAPLIALYRFHFYGHRLALARDVAHQALVLARAALGPRFGQTPPTDTQARHDAAVRFYLFTLKGLAYLNLRLGAWPQARHALDELRQLDPGDHVGGALLGHVLARAQATPEPSDDTEPAAYPAKGWGSVSW